MNCERFEELISRPREPEWTDDEVDEYLNHLTICPTGRHNVAYVERSFGLSEGAFARGSPRHRLPSAAEIAANVFGRRTGTAGRASTVASARPVPARMPRYLLPTLAVCLGGTLLLVSCAYWQQGEELQAQRTEIQARTEMELIRVARLFRSQPADTKAKLAASWEYREACMRTLSESRREPERLYALTGLAGCGTPEALGVLLETVRKRDSSPEERRLALRAAEAIVRRALICGIEKKVTVEVCRDILSTVVALPEKSCWPGLEEDFFDLGRSLSALAVKRGSLGSFRNYVADTLLEKLASLLRKLYPTKDLNVDIGYIAFLASIQEPRAKTLIRAHIDSMKEATQHLLAQLGQVCELYGDQEEIDYALDRCRRPGGRVADTAARAFSWGRARAKSERRGRRPELDGGTVTRAYATPRVAPSPGPAHPDGALARWHFKGTGDDYDVVATGRGIPADPRKSFSSNRVVHGSDSGDDSRVKFVDPGSSEIRLAFETKTSNAHHEIVLTHIKRATQAWPYDGAVLLTVSLDGRVVLADRLAVTIAHWHETPIVVDMKLTPPGRHTLTIRLHRATTTSYSIKSVQIHEK